MTQDNNNNPAIRKIAQEGIAVKIQDRLNVLKTTTCRGTASMLYNELESLNVPETTIEEAWRTHVALANKRAKEVPHTLKPLGTRYDRLQAVQTALDAMADNLDSARGILKESDTAELNELAGLTDRLDEFRGHLDTEMEVLA